MVVTDKENYYDIAKEALTCTGISYQNNVWMCDGAQCNVAKVHTQLAERFSHHFSVQSYELLRIRYGSADELEKMRAEHKSRAFESIALALKKRAYRNLIIAEMQIICQAE
jgi:hypothetical protein